MRGQSRAKKLTANAVAEAMATTRVEQEKLIVKA